MTIVSLTTTMISVPVWALAIGILVAVVFIALFLVVLCAKSQMGDEEIRSRGYNIPECPLTAINEEQAPWQISEESLRDANRQMAEDYVKLQNEYAWYRNLVKHEHPEAHAHAELQIRNAKEEARIKKEAKGVVNG